MEFLDEVRAALRISTADEGIAQEVMTLIEAAHLDLQSAGVKKQEQNGLYKLAIVLFCKAQFGYDNPDAKRFSDSYRMVKEKLMNTKEYRDVS